MTKLKKRGVIIAIAVFLVIIVSGAVFEMIRAAELPENKCKPVFIDVEEGKDLARSFVFWSEPWRLDNRERFLFAVYYPYVLRYDISKNVIDKFVEIKGQDYIRVSISKDGRYMISCLGDDMYNSDGYNYFLTDFETEKTTFLAYAYDENAVNKLPEELRGETEKLVFKSAGSIGNYGTPPYLDHVYDNYNAEDRACTIMYYKSYSKVEKITAIRDIGCGSYTIIDENTIAAIVPIDAELGGYMGFYKIVIADVPKDEIIQEYILMRPEIKN
ncbi:MAG: hypothetical protein LBC56_03715 [Oscillospiraceae bacterium]|jgi:hypothetical protein|nr:hypothetical protein [Oscillospiraceae bacterium]